MAKPFISAAEARAKFDSGALLVDVRTKAEFDAGHIIGADLIPYDSIPSRLSEFPSDKSQEIVVYCKSGQRSGVAQEMLERAGYSNVHNAGGYEEIKSIFDAKDAEGEI